MELSSTLGHPLTRRRGGQAVRVSMVEPSDGSASDVELSRPRQLRVRKCLILLGLALASSSLIVLFFCSKRQDFLVSSSAPTNYASGELSVGAPQDSDSAYVAVVPGVIDVALMGGTCVRIPGPMGQDQYSLVGQVGLWSDDIPHILCIVARPTETVQFVASRVGNQSEDVGDFGFGPGIEVGLRPNIANPALWPLQANVPCVGLKMRGGFRTLVVEAKLPHRTVDVPTVVQIYASPQQLIVVYFADSSLGKCMSGIEEGALRFACRVYVDANADEVALVAICATCGQPTDQIKLSLRERGVASLHSSTQLPWISWASKFSENVEARQWLLTAVVSSRSYDVDIALVVGNAPIDWSLDPSEQLSVRSLGQLLSALAGVICTLMTAIFVAAALRYPAPVSGILPTFSSALCALQFVYLLGCVGSAPRVLRVFCEPIEWVATFYLHQHWYHMLWVLIFVAVSRVVLVFRHVFVNGTGSVSTMPHAIAFGTFELRSLSLLALPFARKAAQLALGARWSQISLECSVLVLSLWHEPNTIDLEGNPCKVEVSPSALSASICGYLLLISFAIMGISVLRRVSTLLSEQLVLLVPAPGLPCPIFVDLVCDQLRAMPFVPGRRSWVDGWTSSSGWHFGPTVAAIQPLQHRGLQEEDQTADIVLFPPGPWTSVRTTPGGGAFLYQDLGVRSMSRLPPPESVVLASHPIESRVRVPYSGSRRYCILGVVGTPWVDAVIDEQAARKLQSSVLPESGSMPLRVHVGQLVGPLTSGRFAACFDWTERLPFRWSIDLLTKTLFGACLGAVDAGLHLNSGWFVWNVLVIGPTLAFLSVTFLKPYNHWVDNFALGTACLACLATSLVFFMGAELSSTTQESAVLLISVLLGWTLFPSLLGCIVLCQGAFFGIRGSWDDVLSQIILGWSRSPKSTPTEPEGYEMMEPESAEGLSHTVDVLLASGAAGVVGPSTAAREPIGPLPPILQQFGTTSVVRLPATLRPTLVRVALTAPKSVGEACTVKFEDDPSGDGGRPVLPLPSSLLFTDQMKSLETIARQHSPSDWFGLTPFGVVSDHQRSQLLFFEQQANGGMTWERLLFNFFNPGEEAVAAQAQRTVRAYLSDSSRPEDALLLVDVLGLERWSAARGTDRVVR